MTERERCAGLFRCSGSIYPSNVGKAEKESLLQRISRTITHSLEKGFASLGQIIGTHPWKFIVSSIFLSSLCGIGILSFYEEQDIDKLWVPHDSWVRINKELSEEHFPSAVLRETIIAASSNILTPAGIAALLDIYQESLTITSSSGVTFSDVCVKAGSFCMVTGVLEIWSFDNARIRSLNQSQINSDIRNTKISPVYGRTLDLSAYLGQTALDDNGDFTARAAALTWYTEGNSEKADMTFDWEEKLIALGNRDHHDLTNVYVHADRSWGDESDKAIQDDVLLLSIGYFIVTVFVLLAIGKFNFMEQKAWLTFGGFICVGLSIIMSIGLASAFGLPYGPVQSVLPFLLLGLGVDDMFVIIGAMENLSPEERQLDIPRQISLILRHAGVSITVTSLTDTVAFLIGTNTIIPALVSFCVYAGIGIIGLYVLQCTFFISCLAIDMERIKANRDGCCLMLKHDSDYTPNDCSKKQLLVPIVLGKGLARLIENVPFKVFILLTTCSLFGVNVWGFIQLKQHFDPFWFIPTDSYLSKFKSASDTYFPNTGVASFIYCGNLNYWERRTDLEKLDRLLKECPYNKNGTTDSWFAALTSWLKTTNDSDILSLINNESYPSSEENFDIVTSRYVNNVAPRLSSYLTFLPSHHNITASRFPYEHVHLESSDNKISAMDAIRNLVQEAGFSTHECYPYSYYYLPWETNRVIQTELYRNLGMAMASVFIVTLLLIANIFTSMIVFMGVIATVVNVAGSMYFWSLTIDTVTSIILILSIGLAVDYSAHIGHRFMTVVGTKQERVKRTIETIGAPVFYGGFSTFLAFILLSQSNSYVFTTFFKVNFLVVIYGLFHGLVFLPVLLSLIGPAPYPQLSDGDKQQRITSPKEMDTKESDNYAFSPKFQNRNHQIKRDSNDGDNKSAIACSSQSPPPLSSTPRDYEFNEYVQHGSQVNIQYEIV